MAVFAENGYRRGSLREIAERVSMSGAGMLHHFPDESSLLAEVLDHHDQLLRDRVDLDAAGRLKTLRGFVELARYNATMPGVVELYCTLSAEGPTTHHPAHEYFIAGYE